jgi:hypothetical protein
VPADHAGWLALAAALVALLAYPLLRRCWARVGLRGWVAGCALLATGLSALWLWHYLRGGPRIIDATSYWLQARGLSHGLLSWPLELPTASFRGRFLLASSDGSSLGGIFPPGYPAVLAAAMVLGAPLALGPVLAGCLVIATAALAKLACRSDDAARMAALLSGLCACLRYHTSDTMSHGWAALCLTCALCFGLAAADAARLRARLAWLAATGLAGGWLVATRPVSALVLVLLGAAVCVHALRARRWRPGGAALGLAALIAGAALPVALLLLHQHAVTGRWLASAQAAYYLVSDGPAGCFRYGFGRGIGCVVEHAPYVSSVLPDGFGAGAALVTTARRLYLHLADVANFEPLWLLVAAGAWMHRASPRVLLLALAPLGLVLAYVPFYFDASYPGGGARLLVDALPAEHVLIAAALARWGGRAAAHGAPSALVACATAAVMLAGFALRGSHQHALLRERDGGRPLYDPALVAASTAPRSLVFVDGDHAFNLGHDPSSRSAQQGRVVARARGDDRDRLLWQRLGQPPAWRFRLDPWGPAPAAAHLEPWSAPAQAGAWRFEAEAEWPPLAQHGGYALAAWLSPSSCVSSGIALGLVRTGPQQACVTVEVPWPGEQPWQVVPSLVLAGPARVQLQLETGSDVLRWPLPERLEPASWPGAERAPDGRWCVPMPGVEARGTCGAGRLTLCSLEEWVALDAVVLRDTSSQYH